MNNYSVEDVLVDLAQKAGSFMVTLVSLLEKGLVSTFSDPDSMNSIIKGLTKCVLISHSCSAKELLVLTKFHRVMNRVLGVVNKNSSQRLPSRLLLSASDKATINECNRQIALACGIFKVYKLSVSSQSAQARFLLIKLDPNCIHRAKSHHSAEPSS